MLALPVALALLQTGPPRLDLSSSVIYEANLRAMGPQKAFIGLRQRLPQIQKLGVNLLWLMPIHPIGQLKGVGSPYAVQNYRAVNPEFGTDQDFRALVAEAKRLGMKVILDWVANHTAWDNPWIQRPEWYVRDGNGNIIIPPGTNWQDVAELNYANAEMRAEMVQSMRYWVNEYDVDGFRCDYVDGVPDDFWSQTISSLRTATFQKPLFFLAEGSRDSLVNSLGFDARYEWGLSTLIKEIFRGQKPASAFYSSAVANRPGHMRFITNHDESAWNGSVPAQFGSVQAGLAAFQALAFTGGMPMIYSSQEIGYASQLPFFTPTVLDWTSQPTLRAGYQSAIRDFRSLGLPMRPTVENASTDKIIALRASGKRGKIVALINTRSSSATVTLPQGWLTTGSSVTLQGYEVRRWLESARTTK